MSNWIWKGIEWSRQKLSIRSGLLILLGLALLLWDWVTLPLYGATKFSVLFIPVLCAFLLGLTVLLHVYFVGKQKRDPVRRSHRSFTLDLAFLMVLNLLGLFLFFKAWLFTSLLLRVLSLTLLFINFLVGFTLILVFGMGWHRFEFQDNALRKAYIANISKQTGHWYELPPAVVGNKKWGWDNPSSLIIDALFQRFQDLYGQTIDQLLVGHSDYAVQEDHTKHFRWHQVKRKMEQCFKLGRLLALHCDLFHDKNGNHQLLASQVYWQLLNAHLLQLELWPVTSQAPASALAHELLELERLHNFYKVKKDRLSEKIPDQFFAESWPEWQENTLKGRLIHFYLHGIYECHFGETPEDKKTVLRQHLQEAPDIMKSMLGEEVLEDLRHYVQQFFKTQEQPINADHLVREIMTRLDLSTPVLDFYQLLHELKQREPDPDGVYHQEFSQWNDIPYAMEGIKVKNRMQLDVTRLLMLTPPVQDEDLEAKTTDFETLWQCAGLIWLLTDLVYFERAVPAQHYQELLEQLNGDLDDYPYAIKREIRALVDSVAFQRRWQENDWRHIQRTRDAFKVLM